MAERAYNEIPEEGPGPVGYVALVLAWVVPGAGHLAIKQYGRAILFFITIHALFAGGMLIGGLRAINPPDQAIWTYTEYLTGWPMLVASHLEKTIYEPQYVTPLYKIEPTPLGQQPEMRSAMEKAYSDGRPSIASDVDIPARKAYAENFFKDHPLFTYHPKVQDVGAVYCGIAGMLNLLVIFDVLLRVTGATRPERNTPEKPTPSPTAEATK